MLFNKGENSLTYDFVAVLFLFTYTHILLILVLTYVYLRTYADVTLLATKYQTHIMVIQKRG